MFKPIPELRKCVGSAHSAVLIAVWFIATSEQASHSKYQPLLLDLTCLGLFAAPFVI